MKCFLLPCSENMSNFSLHMLHCSNTSALRLHQVIRSLWREISFPHPNLNTGEKWLHLFAILIIFSCVRLNYWHHRSIPKWNRSWTAMWSPKDIQDLVRGHSDDFCSHEWTCIGGLHPLLVDMARAVMLKAFRLDSCCVPPFVLQGTAGRSTLLITAGIPGHSGHTMLVLPARRYWQLISNPSPRSSRLLRSFCTYYLQNRLSSLTMTCQDSCVSLKHWS